MRSPDNHRRIKPRGCPDHGPTRKRKKALADQARRRYPLVPRNGAGCIRCGLTLDQAKILWDVTPALWCTECYVGHFPIQSARGIMSRKDGLYTPMIVPELPMDLETRAEVVWNSLKAESGRTAVVTEYPNGIHYPVYTKMWEFPGGGRVSTAHLTDGRFVAVGPRLPPLRTATGNHRGPTKPVTRAVETQTEWMVWCWEDRAGEISEIEPMAVDNLAVEANPDVEPEPPQQPPSIPTTPPEEPPTLQREDPVSKEYQEVKEQADARVTAILTQLDLSDRATPAADEEAETPCMDELLVIDRWDASPEPPQLSPVPSENPDVLLLQDDGEGDDFCPPRPKE
ncbi:hypothetical protein D5F01_LYC23845 [Larimichthys crocea]|uniref:Uncharacterized protein n=1 Tax=Larimichthys crocea TaxID=215358 RepID=A0A6G0HFS2_LARCR|nr:hypothetical protein D5F01_LYC23845 [Larimichthys crocea]